MKTLPLDRETLTNHAFYQLILYALILGGVVGIATAAFLLAEHWLVELLWVEIPQQIGPFPLYTLIVCTLGGLLVGLCQRYLGDYPKELQEALAVARTEGGFDYKHVPQGVVISLVSLGFGGALGPEAALMGLAGGLGTLAARQLKLVAHQVQSLTYFSVSAALGAFFGSPLGAAALPLESPEQEELPKQWVWIPGIIAALAGLGILLLLAGNTLSSSYTFVPYESPRNGSDMLWAIPLAIVGALLGRLSLWLKGRIHHWVGLLSQRKIWRGLLGGIVLGVVATMLPLVLFSGQEGIQQMLEEGAEIGSGILVLSAIGKLLLVYICLATGWKGGEFFPIMFAGAALGLAIGYLIPALHPMVGLAAVMSATTAAVLRRPLAVALLLLFLLPNDLIQVIVVGAVVSGAASRL